MLIFIMCQKATNNLGKKIPITPLISLPGLERKAIKKVLNTEVSKYQTGCF